MKKSLLLFSLTIALTFLSKAQTSVYHPFPDSDAVWNVDWTIYDNSVWCLSSMPEAQFSYIFTGDTSMRGFIYHKIWSPYTDAIDTCDNFHPNWSGYQGFIRQNIAQKKVYIIFPYDTIEYLLYDFNLQIGDSVKCFINSGVIVSIDSILIGSNYRKRWAVGGGVGGGYHFIEGIGSVGDLLQQLCGTIDGWEYALMCFSQDGSVLYRDSSFLSTSCNIISSVNNLSEKKISVTLSPNPFRTTATLEIKNEELGIRNWELKIYDVMGRIIRTVAVSSGSKQEIKIERGDLGNGLYFYQLSATAAPSYGGRSMNYQLIATGKFIVN